MTLEEEMQNDLTPEQTAWSRQNAELASRLLPYFPFLIAAATGQLEVVHPEFYRAQMRDFCATFSAEERIIIASFPFVDEEGSAKPFALAVLGEPQ